MTPLGRASRGMTLVELAVAVAVAGIIAAVSLGLIRYGLQMFIYMPAQARVSQGAAEIMNAIIEGSWTTLPVPAQDNPLPGLRSVWTLEGAWLNQVQFTFREAQGYEVSICWIEQIFGVPTNGVFRSLAPGCPLGSQTERIPYHSGEQTMQGKLVVSGQGAPPVVFRYFDVAVDGTETVLTPNVTGDGFVGGATLADVDRIEIALLTQTGGGQFTQGQGQISLLSSVALRALHN